jgi:hypothetical protein
VLALRAVAVLNVTGDICTSRNERESFTRGGGLVMSITRHKPAQIVTLVRQIEVGIAIGETTHQACKEVEISIQT